MNAGSFQIPVLFTAAFAAAAFFIIPITAVTMSRSPAKAPTKNTESADGTSCDLPPVVKIDGVGSDNYAAGLPPLDRQKAETIRTATFALG